MSNTSKRKKVKTRVQGPQLLEEIIQDKKEEDLLVLLLSSPSLLRFSTGTSVRGGLAQAGSSRPAQLCRMGGFRPVSWFESGYSARHNSGHAGDIQ